VFHKKEPRFNRGFFVDRIFSYITTTPMKNQIQATLAVTNLLNGESFNRPFLCTGERQALRMAENLSRQNPDCLVSIASLEGMFFHMLKPINMTKDLTLVTEGKMEFSEYCNKWAGIQNDYNAPAKPRKGGRKEKAKRVSDSGMFCQSAA